MTLSWGKHTDNKQFVCLTAVWHFFTKEIWKNMQVIDLSQKCSIKFILFEIFSNRFLIDLYFCKRKTIKL